MNWKRIICWWSGHKRGVKTMLPGEIKDGLIQWQLKCPRCGATWTKGNRPGKKVKKVKK